MSELTPQAMAILEAARRQTRPDPEARARIRAGLTAKLSQGAMTQSVPLATQSVWGSSAMKFLAGALLVGATAVGIQQARIHARTDNGKSGSTTQATLRVGSEPVIAKPTTRLPQPVVPSAPGASLPGPGLARSEELARVSAAPLTQPAPIVRTRPARSHVVRSEQPTQVEAAVTTSTVTRTTSSALVQPVAETVAETAPLEVEEWRLLRRARGALSSEPARALQLANEFVQRYPHSALEEEATAIRVYALCAQSRWDEGRSAVASFVSRWPASIHSVRIRNACAPRP